MLQETDPLLPADEIVIGTATAMSQAEKAKRARETEFMGWINQLNEIDKRLSGKFVVRPGSYKEMLKSLEGDFEEDQLWRRKSPTGLSGSGKRIDPNAQIWLIPCPWPLGLEKKIAVQRGKNQQDRDAMDNISNKCHADSLVIFPNGEDMEIAFFFKPQKVLVPADAQDILDIVPELLKERVQFLKKKAEKEACMRLFLPNLDATLHITT